MCSFGPASARTASSKHERASVASNNWAAAVEQKAGAPSTGCLGGTGDSGGPNSGEPNSGEPGSGGPSSGEPNSGGSSGLGTAAQAAA